MVNLTGSLTPSPSKTKKIHIQLGASFVCGPPIPKAKSTTCPDELPPEVICKTCLKHAKRHDDGPRSEFSVQLTQSEFWALVLLQGVWGDPHSRKRVNSLLEKLGRMHGVLSDMVHRSTGAPATLIRVSREFTRRENVQIATASAGAGWTN